MLARSTISTRSCSDIGSICFNDSAFLSCQDREPGACGNLRLISTAYPVAGVRWDGEPPHVLHVIPAPVPGMSLLPRRPVGSDSSSVAGELFASRASAAADVEIALRPSKKSEISCGPPSSPVPAE